MIKFSFILLKLNYFNWKRKRGISMNTLVIVLIAAVLLSCAYVFYGRWLANKWGIDPKAETPAKKFEDGKDYVPTDGWTVFSHQFRQLQVQVLLPVQFRQRYLDGFLFAVGTDRRYFLRSSNGFRCFICEC